MFKDREEAGALIADALANYKRKDALVLALPRGGLPVARVIARQLSLPLDILVVKKLGHPDDPELAIGAVSEHDYELNSLARSVSQHYIKEQIKKLQNTIITRTAFLRENKSAQAIRNRIIILVDDGVATGATMILAIHVLRKQQPREIVIATPVAPLETVSQLENVADTVVCLQKPVQFTAVGVFYQNFNEVDDATAQALLR